jgi:hypothetical protein
VLNTAEGAGMLDRTQRGEVVDWALREMQRGAARPDGQTTEFFFSNSRLAARTCLSGLGNGRQLLDHDAN